MTARFVHLRLHSEYSLTDSTVRIDELVKACAKRGMPALALTDDSNVFALLKFFKECEGKGIQPIAGADVWVQESEEPARLTLLCQDRSGYRNLCILLSRAYSEGRQLDRPVLQRDWLAGHTQGLVALSGGMHGEIGRLLLAGREETAVHALAGELHRALAAPLDAKAAPLQPEAELLPGDSRALQRPSRRELAGTLAVEADPLPPGAARRVASAKDLGAFARHEERYFAHAPRFFRGPGDHQREVVFPGARAVRAVRRAQIDSGSRKDHQPCFVGGGAQPARRRACDPGRADAGMKGGVYTLATFP